jgi:glycosyltransferase involved in cell wall biosynthesis
VRQPASVPGDFTAGGSSHPPTTLVSPQRPTGLTWGGAEDGIKALPIPHTDPFYSKPFKLSILMAVYNEEKTLIRAIDEVLSADCPCEIELIIVDDGSVDRTPMLLAGLDDPRVIMHRHPVNLGKGAALLSAASLASGTYVLPFDADLEYAAEDIPRLLAPVLKGRCEVVYGVRLFGYNTVYRTYVYAIGNQLLTRMANLLFNAHLSDLHTCLKMMPLATMRSFDLCEKGFGLDSEITAKLLRRGIRPFEVPVSYYSRSHAEGKKITWRDAIACARILLRVRLRDKSEAEHVSDRPDEADCSHVLSAEVNPQAFGHIPANTRASN